MWLWPLLRPFWALWSAFGFFVLVEALGRLTVPFYYKLIFDRVLPDRDAHLLLVSLAVMVGVVATILVMELLQSSLSARAGIGAVNRIRALFFEYIQGLTPELIGRVRAGDLVDRFTSDIGIISRLLTISLYKVTINVLVGLFSVAALFVVEWRLAIFAVLAMAVSMALPKKMLGANAVGAEQQRRRDEGTVSAHVGEALAAHQVVSAFSLERLMSERFATVLAVVNTSARRAVLLSTNLDKTIGIGVMLVQLLIVALGAYLVTRGALTAGGLVGFVGLLLNVGTAATNLTAFIPDLVQGASSAARLREMLGEEAGGSGADAAAGAEPVRMERAIELRGVTFAYEDRTVLENISLTIPAGQSVAFVGRSGSGKSTLVSLLMRRYEPASGTIAIDGRDIKTMAPSAVRAQIGAVFQSTFLFNTTVRENIRLGRTNASDAEVEAAARAAQVHDFLAEMPLGYDTIVGEGGSVLSGGQQQRIALARAIVRNPQILIMDEATSALDPATEVTVNATLAELSVGRTSLAVTHRLASVMGMDRVVVFDKGYLIEDGPPSELLARGGTFASLWQKQNSFSVNASGTHARLDSMFLRTIPIFAEVDDTRLDGLADSFRSEFHEGGARIITRGESGEIFYIIVRGRVEVLGAQDAAWILEDGDFFGEIALLADVPRTATVNTLERCLFLTLHRDQFRALLQNDAGLRAAFERVMQERLEQPAAH